MAGRLMALDKCPGVRPVGIGKAIQQLMANLVHTITSFQAMEAYRSHNLCAGLKAGIEVAVHASIRDFGRKTPPNSVSSDSHPEEANGLGTAWEGEPESTDPQDEKDVEGALLNQPPPY